MKYKDDLINYRLNRARDTVVEAQLMADNKKWNACLNRLYYACFYAVNALFVKYGYSAKTHSGTRTLFGLHFIKTGFIPESSGALYATLFDKRQESDYEDFVEIPEEFANELIPQVIEFINLAEKLIQK